MDDPWRAVEAAARDTESGAAEIARAAAEALLALDADRVPPAIRTLIRGHPSMAPLWRLGSEAISAPDHRDGVRRFLHILDRDRLAAQVLAQILPSTVLTISWSSAVIEALEIRRPDRVVCMSSEPGNEGVRTAEALRDAGLDAVVLNDAEAIATVPAEAVAVGADAVTPEAVVNKVGTTSLARAAGERGVPCFTVAGETKFVAVRLPVTGPFEATPLSLFTSVAAPAGALTPDGARDLAGRCLIDPRLAALLDEFRPYP